MTEYRVMHGDHLAFVLLRRLSTGEIIRAVDFRMPNGRQPLACERIACGTCGCGFDSEELTRIIKEAQDGTD